MTELPARADLAQLRGQAKDLRRAVVGGNLAALKRAIHALNLELTHVTPERLQSAISWAKNNLIKPDAYEPRAGSPLGSVVQRIYPRYQELLLAANAADFDDLVDPADFQEAVSAAASVR